MYPAPNGTAVQVPPFLHGLAYLQISVENDQREGFDTRYMKDYLAYRGAVLWNTISLNEPGFSHRNQNELYTID